LPIETNTMHTKIKIGTRGSKLALWQAYHVEHLLQQKGMRTEIVVIETKGDKILNQPLAQIGSKGLFTEELEEKLLNGEIDIAVHSAKDLQSELNIGLEIIAFSKREKPNDVLVSFDKNFSLQNKGTEIRVATSSTRRRAILKRNYPHVTLVDVRGNLQTRFRKMEEGLFDAMLLAYAGVHRMDYDDKIVHLLPLSEFIPAVGQGSIAIEAAVTLDTSKKDLIRTVVNDTTTEYCLLAERSFLKKLQGGCSVPLFALAEIKENILTIQGGIVGLDGKEYVHLTCSGKTTDAIQIGNTLAEELLSKGAGQLLETIRLQKQK
jgi:hydroxymethylbilane synthase